MPVVSLLCTGNVWDSQVFIIQQLLVAHMNGSSGVGSAADPAVALLCKLPVYHCGFWFFSCLNVIVSLSHSL